MANFNKPVTIKVDRNYFDKIFEPGRKKLQNKLGVNFTQTKYTAYLAKSQLKIKNPKRSSKFAPRGFTFSL